MGTKKPFIRLFPNEKDAWVVLIYDTKPVLMEDINRFWVREHTILISGMAEYRRFLDRRYPTCAQEQEKKKEESTNG